MSIRVWDNSGFHSAKNFNVKIWLDGTPEPAESTREIIYDRVKPRKVALVMAKAWAETRSLDAGEHVVHIKDTDTGRTVDVNVSVASVKEIAVSLG